MDDPSGLQFGAEKMFLHADRLAEWQAGRLPAPVTVELNVTNLCNHACPDCTFSYLVNVDKSSLPLELAQRAVREMAAIGVRAVTFSGGGEPLVYGQERVLALMELCADLGMQTALITNGSKLTSDRFLALCQWVRVSLDAYDEVTFARFHGRGPGEFEKVCRRLREYAALALQRKAAGQACATLGVGFLTDADSVVRDDLPKMAEFCAGFPGLDYVQFRPLVINMVADPSLSGGQFGDLSALRASYRAAQQFARDDFRVLWSGGKYDALGQPHAGRSYGRCLAHFLEAVVAADARVYICCHTQGQPQACLGDLRTHSFGEIWWSELAQAVYEAIDPRIHCPPACRLHLQNRALQQLTESVHPNFI